MQVLDTPFSNGLIWEERSGRRRLWSATYKREQKSGRWADVAKCRACAEECGRQGKESRLMPIWGAHYVPQPHGP